MRNICKKDKIIIDNYEDLIRIISIPELSDKLVIKITNKALNIFCMNEIKDRNEFVKQVEDFISKFGEEIDRPLFL